MEVEYVWLILKTDLRPLLSRGGRSRARKRAVAAVGTVLYLGFVALIGYGAFRLFAHTRSLTELPEVLRQAVDINFLSGVTLFVLVMALLTGLQTTYKTIYESDDIGFLMAHPVPVQAIFTAKLMTSYSGIAAIAMGFGLPAWIGYGVAVHAGLSFYVVAVVSFAMLLLAVHSVISLLILAAMRFLPGRRMKQLFIASTAILGVLVVFLSQLLSSRVGRAGDASMMIEMLSKGNLGTMWYLPSTWMVGLTLGALPGSGVNPYPRLAALGVLALALFAAAIRLSGRWFMIGWAGRTEELDSGRRRSRARAGQSAAPVGGYWAVLRKDLRLLLRDPLVWYNLAIGVIVVGFFIFNMANTVPEVERTSDETAIVLGGVTLMMPVLMGSVTGAQTGGVSISREGPSFWLVRGSPVDAAEFLRAKMTYAILPPGLLFILATTAMRAFGMAPLPLGTTLLLGGSMVLAVSSAQILLDVFFPDFTLKIEFGSSKSGRGTGKLLTTVFSSMGLAFLFTFILSLPATPLPGRFLPGVSTASVVVATRCAVIAIGAGSAACVATFGVRRIRRVLRDM